MASKQVPGVTARAENGPGTSTVVGNGAAQDNFHAAGTEDTLLSMTGI